MTWREVIELLDQWRTETAIMSSISGICAHPAYRRLVERGEPVAQFVLLRMMQGEVQIGWFCLLHDVYGLNPVAPEDAGNVPEMARQWVRWARDSGQFDA